MDIEGRSKEKLRKCNLSPFPYSLFISLFSFHFLFVFSLSLHFLRKRHGFWRYVQSKNTHHFLKPKRWKLQYDSKIVSKSYSQEHSPSKLRPLFLTQSRLVVMMCRQDQFSRLFKIEVISSVNHLAHLVCQFLAFFDKPTVKFSDQNVMLGTA